MQLIGVTLGASWDNGQAWLRFQCLQRGSGLGMGTCEESLMASKADSLPLTTVDEAGPARVGVISMFDGVGSIYHIIKKKLGKPPSVYIAAEQDPVLHRLVAAELGMREDQHWGYNSEGVGTIYVKDVWDLLHKDSLILRQAKAMY